MILMTNPALMLMTLNATQLQILLQNLSPEPAIILLVNQKLPALALKHLNSSPALTVMNRNAVPVLIFLTLLITNPLRIFLQNLHTNSPLICPRIVKAK